MTGETDVQVVDVRPPLMEAKQRERVYYLTDTHWNDRGALVAYQRIVDAARHAVPTVPPAWTRDDFTAVLRHIEGQDLAGMIGLKRVIGETEVALVPKRPRKARVIEPAGADLKPIPAMMDDLATVHADVQKVMRDVANHMKEEERLTKEVNGHHVWTGEVRFNEEWLTQPLHWRWPRMIFG